MASGERDLTRGSVWRQVLAYAMPLVASSLLQALYSMVDTVIAGHFAGSAAISAINNSGQILNILTKIAIGITTGGNIIIGQYYGAKEQGRLGEASGTLLSLSLLLGAATAVGLYAGAYPLLGLLGAPAMEQSVAYLRICAVGMVFVFGYNALSAVLRGVGDSRTPLLIIGVATVVNTVLDLWFVAGLGMGTAGAALATTAAQAVSFGMALVLVARRTGLLQPKLSFFRMHGALLRLILRLGIPSALQMTIAGFSWLVVTFLVNQYGVNVSAGNGVAIKIKDICQLFISAMASGATTMIAQNLGASKFERAKDVMYTAMKITCAMAAAMIVLVELFAPQMAAVPHRRPSAISRALPAVSSRSTTFSAGWAFRKSPHCIRAIGCERTSLTASSPCPGSAAATCEMRSFCSPTIRARLCRSSSWLGSRLPAMVFSMAAMPSSAGSPAIWANSSPKLRQGTTSIASSRK